MAAHIRSIEHECNWPSCSKRATHELRNTFNAVQGLYCYQHAQRALRDFQEQHEANASR